MKTISTGVLAVCFYSLLATACTNELKKDAPEEDRRIRQLSISEFVVEVKGLDRPNDYQVIFAWPEAQGNIRISERAKVLGVMPGSNKTFTDDHIAGGSERSYLVEHISSDGRITSSFPLSVRIPLDIFWDEAINLSDHLKIEAGRVFLSSRALVTTFDKNLTIIAKEFISEGGTIQSFPEGASAFWEKNGRSGGTISIMAEMARGSLQVHLRGEAGGHGKNGVITFPGRHPGCAGTSGGNGGSAGNLSILADDGHGLNISYENKEGSLGEAGVRGSVPDSTPDAVYPPCDRDARNGVNGVPGGKGQVCLKLSKDEKYVCAQ